MTLKDIIEALEAEDPNRILPVGFNSPHSYRGYYDQLGFEPATDISIGDMLAAARSALGATFQGYKGGDYTMGPYTDCWIAEYGRSSEDMIGPVLLRLLLGRGQEVVDTNHEKPGDWRAAIVEVLCSQALADDLGDVRDAEGRLWKLLGIEEPVPEHDSAWRNTKDALRTAGIPLPEHLADDEDEPEATR